MAEKPILFNTEMVKAILNGRKTVTRRIAIPNSHLKEFRDDEWWYQGRVYKDFDDAVRDLRRNSKSCKWNVGDILYVRETWLPFDADHIIDGVKYAYRADCTAESERIRIEYGYKWRPSIHMPKEAARIFLRVTDIRVEQLQDCGTLQAKEEGCACCSQFARLWDGTIKKKDLGCFGWIANPWVWVIEFERIEHDETNL